jgi:hypothetical protein
LRGLIIPAACDEGIGAPREGAAATPTLGTCLRYLQIQRVRRQDSGIEAKPVGDWSKQTQRVGRQDSGNKGRPRGGGANTVHQKTRLGHGSRNTHRCLLGAHTKGGVVTEVSRTVER